MPATPDNIAYLYLGLATITTIMTLFIGSLVLRYRRATAALVRIQRYAADPTKRK
jgi:hypothetical protein